jgi:hypothetical protein
LCFSDDGPDTGPHPVSQEELRAAFNPSNGWNVVAIEPDRFQTRYHDDGAPAWFATIKRIQTAGLVGGRPPAVVRKASATLVQRSICKLVSGFLEVGAQWAT